MPFRIALSGLNAASAELRVIGNNVANASTTGYKKSRTEFADIFATSSLGTTANAIGAGVRVSSVAQQFTQGNIGFTDNNLDLAISGQGFFQLSDNGVSVYSRAGTFRVDRDGFVVNGQAQQLMGYGADSSGRITGALGNIQLDTSNIRPSATTEIDMGLTLNASHEVPVPPEVSDSITLSGTTLDTFDSPVTSAPIDMVDNYGNVITGNLVLTHQGGTSTVWDADFQVAGTSQLAAVGSIDVGTDTSITLDWNPTTAPLPQATVPLTMDVSALTQVTTTGPGTTNVTAAGSGAAQGAFSVTNADTFNDSTSVTVFDSQGGDHLATTYFRKTGTPNQWELYSYVDGTRISGPDIVSFTGQGELQPPIAPGPGSSVDPTGSLLTTSSVSLPSTGADPLTLTYNFSDMKQYGSAFTVNSLSQNGFATGRLSGVDIADNGIMTARFTNGQSRTLGQLALANFQNPQGMRQLGDTTWADTFESGAPLVGAPGTGSLGLIESGALEGSNVDLTEQLVGMITAQRNFQANAQVISTADTVTQTIINIR